MAMILDGTNGAFLPTWTTGTRPASPANGQIGYNSTTGQIDQYVGSAWSSVPTGSASAATPTVLGTVYASTLDTSGNATTAVGYQALRVNTGSSNVALGATALYTNTSGARSVAVGYGALYTNNGNENVAVGVSALQLNTSGAGNTAIGAYASASNLTSSYNTAVGYSALQLATSASNVAIGTSALYNVTGGTGNVGIGREAGLPVTTGEYNTYVGYKATGSGTAASYEVVIAAGPSGYTGKGTSTAFINGGAGPTYNGGNTTTWNTTSDQRLKKNIVDNNVGLEKIVQVQVRNFEYRTKDEVTDLPKNQTIEKSGVQLGFIAQELQQVLPDCVIEESTGVLSVNADNVFYHLVNAVKELSAELNALKAKVGI